MTRLSSAYFLTPTPLVVNWMSRKVAEIQLNVPVSPRVTARSRGNCIMLMLVHFVTGLMGRPGRVRELCAEDSVS